MTDQKRDLPEAIADHPLVGADIECRHGKYKWEQLWLLFDQVSNPDNWKQPIDVMCDGEAVLPICDAIEFFTASAPTVDLDTRTMRYRVHADGYYASAGC